MDEKEMAELRDLGIFSEQTLAELKKMTSAELLKKLEAETWRLDISGKIREVLLDEYREHFKSTRKDNPSPLQTHAMLYNQLSVRKAARIPKDHLVEELKAVVASATDEDGNVKTPDTNDFATVFENHHNFAKIIGDKKSHLLLKTGNVYKEGAPDMIKKKTESAYPQTNIEFKNEIVSKIADRNPVDRKDFDKNPRILNLLNGFLDIERGELVDLPEYKSMQQLDVEFRPELGRSEKFEKFTEQVQPVTEKREGLLDACSTMYLKDAVKFARITILQGETQTGKSTWLKALLAPLGKDCYTTIPLQKVERDIHSLWRMDGKYANIYFDLPDKALKNVDNMKSLVDLESIEVNRKFVDQWDMIFTGHMFFAANDLPELPDKSRAITRRLLIFKFETRFTEETKDYGLQDRLTTPEERSKILNSMLPRIQKVLKAGRVQYYQEHEEILNMWEMHSSSSTQFAHKIVERTAKHDSKIKVTTAYDMYIKWCSSFTPPKKVETHQSFNLSLKKQLYEQFNTTKDGINGLYWVNMRVKADKGSEEQAQQTL